MCATTYFPDLVELERCDFSEILEFFQELSQVEISEYLDYKITIFCFDKLKLFENQLSSFSDTYMTLERWLTPNAKTRAMCALSRLCDL